MLALVRLLGLALGEIGWLCGIRKEVTLSNLRLAFPEMRDRDRRRIGRQSTVGLATVFAEFLYLRYASRRAIEDGIAIENLQEIMSVVGEQGAILLGGHSGNWEWLAMAFGMQAKRPVSVIIKNQRSSFAEHFIIRMRTRFGNKMLNAGDGRGIFRAMKNGEMLGILGDQTAAQEDLRVPFFGRMVPTFEGAARLALQAKAPIVFFELISRTGSGYRWRLRLIDHSDLSGSTPENIRILTERHTAVLEATIRKHPQYWLWQHKRWKHATPIS